jgi:hypothetical protein
VSIVLRDVFPIFDRSVEVTEESRGVVDVEKRTGRRNKTTSLSPVVNTGRREWG